MKKCPFCAYRNEDAAAACGICGAPLAGVKPEAPPPAPRRRPGVLPLLAGWALLACAFFLYRRAPAPKPVPSPADGFTYEGVLASVTEMKKLRYLPHADRASLIPLLSSPDDKVAVETARALGPWARSSEDPARRREFSEALAAAAENGSRAVRRQAAVEAGLTIAFGFDPAPYLPRLRRAAESLSADGNEELNAAGFFLASMAGFTDLAPRLETILSGSHSGYQRLHAACALGRFGSRAGNAYLLRAASGAEFGDEAMICLAYSSSPEALPFLERVAAGGQGSRAAGSAKIALTLRKQLAIINH